MNGDLSSSAFTLPLDLFAGQVYLDGNYIPLGFQSNYISTSLNLGVYATATNTSGTVKITVNFESYNATGANSTQCVLTLPPPTQATTSGSAASTAPSCSPATPLYSSASAAWKVQQQILSSPTCGGSVSAKINGAYVTVD